MSDCPPIRPLSSLNHDDECQRSDPDIYQGCNQLVPPDFQAVNLDSLLNLDNTCAFPYFIPSINSSPFPECAPTLQAFHSYSTHPPGQRPKQQLVRPPENGDSPMLGSSSYLVDPALQGIATFSYGRNQLLFRALPTRITRKPIW